jgi:hypothetical protein
MLQSRQQLLQRHVSKIGVFVKRDHIRPLERLQDIHWGRADGGAGESVVFSQSDTSIPRVQLDEAGDGTAKICRLADGANDQQIGENTRYHIDNHMA